MFRALNHRFIFWAEIVWFVVAGGGLLIGLATTTNPDVLRRVAIWLAAWVLAQWLQNIVRDAKRRSDG